MDRWKVMQTTTAWFNISVQTPFGRSTGPKVYPWIGVVEGICNVFHGVWRAIANCLKLLCLEFFN